MIRCVHCKFDSVTTLRCTAKLRKRLYRVGDPLPSPSDASVLGEWYADLVVRRPRQLALFVNARTLLPFVIPASPAPGILLWMGDELERILVDIGVDPARASKEAAHLHPSNVTIAPTASRQVLGSMTDFKHLLHIHLDAGDSPHEASLRMADAPCSPLGMDRPRDVALSLFLK